MEGGYDSSLVAAIIQQHTDKDLQTFTIGFSNNEFNEANYAMDIAEYLAKHSELYCSETDVLRVVEGLQKYGMNLC